MTRPGRCASAISTARASRECDSGGLIATCIQHEIDHLNGVLFIDYISRLKRDRVVKKFAKARRSVAARPA